MKKQYKYFVSYNYRGPGAFISGWGQAPFNTDQKVNALNFNSFYQLFSDFITTDFKKNKTIEENETVAVVIMNFICLGRTK